MTAWLQIVGTVTAVFSAVIGAVMLSVRVARLQARQVLFERLDAFATKSDLSAIETRLMSELHYLRTRIDEALNGAVAARRRTPRQKEET